MIVLYHFCAAHMKDAILKEGLTLGTYPVLTEKRMIRGVQWLTKEKDPAKQSWATRCLVRYSRTAFRLTIQIPDHYRKKLHLARDWVKNFHAEDQALVADWIGSENWYVYLGKIPPKWIVGCRKMEEAAPC